MRVRDLVFASALVALGCGDTGTSVLVVGKTGDPSIQIALDPSALDGMGTVQHQGRVEYDPGDDPVIAVYAALKELDLRPPGVCVPNTQCGQLRLELDGYLNNQSATTYVEAHLAKLDAPTGFHTITVSVVFDSGVTIVDHESKPLVASFDLDAEPKK